MVLVDYFITNEVCSSLRLDSDLRQYFYPWRWNLRMYWPRKSVFLAKFLTSFSSSSA